MSAVELDPGLFDWMALRRARDGGVARIGEGFFDRGRRISAEVNAALERLLAEGALVLAAPDPCLPQRRVQVSEAGQARYAELSEQHERPRWAPDPGGGAVP